MNATAGSDMNTAALHSHEASEYSKAIRYQRSEREASELERVGHYMDIAEERFTRDVMVSEGAITDLEDSMIHIFGSVLRIAVNQVRPDLLPTGYRDNETDEGILMDAIRAYLDSQEQKAKQEDIEGMAA